MEPQFVILELFGHRQRAGWLSEEEIAGAGFLRLDIPQTGDPPMRTEWYATAAVYAIHPSTEEEVRKFGQPLSARGAGYAQLIEHDDFWESDNEAEDAQEDADQERVERHIQEEGGVHS